MAKRDFVIKKVMLYEYSFKLKNFGNFILNWLEMVINESKHFVTVKKIGMFGDRPCHKFSVNIGRQEQNLETEFGLLWLFGKNMRK